MSGSAATLARAAGPTVYVDVDGLTGYQKASACNASMVFSDLLEALAESRVFKAFFDGVHLGLCRVYFMGQDEPAPNTTTGGTLLSGKRTALSSKPEAESGSEVYLRVDTSAARSSAAAAGAGGPAATGAGAGVLAAAGAGFAQGLVEALKMEDVRRALRDVIGRRSPPKAAAAEAAEGAAAAEAAGGAGAAGAGAGNSRGLSAISTPAYSAASSVSSEVSAEPVVLEAGRAAVLGAGEPVALGGGGAGSLLTDNDAESADSAARVSGSSGTRTRSLADGTTVTEE